MVRLLQSSRMTTADMFEEAGALLDLDYENPKEAARRAGKLFKLMKRVDLHQGDACELYQAAMRLATILKYTRPKLGIKVLQWAWGLDCDSKSEALYRYDLGCCHLYMRGKERQAAEELCRAVELCDPEDQWLPLLCDDAALACERIGDYERAVRHLRKVVAMMRDDTSYEAQTRVQLARIGIAESYWNMGRDEGAMAVLEQVLKLENLSPGVRPRAHTVRGDIHACGGEYEQAAAEYRKGIEAVETDIERRRVSPHVVDLDIDVSKNLRRLRKDLARVMRRCERRFSRK